MNGRIYDLEIARFLSPDPIIQDPYNLLNYNRYSYCLNNPLKYSDPSGFQVAPVEEPDKDLNPHWGEHSGYHNHTGGGGGGGGCPYRYDSATDTYRDSYGDIVPFDMVYYDYIRPNSQAAWTGEEFRAYLKIMEPFFQALNDFKETASASLDRNSGASEQENKTEGIVSSISLGFAFGGGFGFEFGMVTDSYGESKLFISSSANIGYGIGAQMNIRYIYTESGKTFHASDYFGYSQGISGGVYEFGGYYGGNKNQWSFYDFKDMGATYMEKGIGWSEGSKGPIFGIWWSNEKTSPIFKQ
jgi:hypothetical protein